MILKEMKPRRALNKAFLKVKPSRAEIEDFKGHLVTLLDRTNEVESEEFHKNLVSDFLKDTYYKLGHFINTRGRNDLVIHNGPSGSSSVGVIMEAKKPTNRAEMITPQRLNAKAMQELVLYYLRERITHKNLEVKHLVVTNVHEWFIFDAVVFERLFAQNKGLVKQFQDFEGGRLADTRTDFFYKQIAEPFIAGIAAEVEFTYFDLRDYDKPLRNADKGDDHLLIALYKVLSPEHLLKLPFANDSNSLDKRFYSELLHIVGLAETKEGGKKLIGRNRPGERHTASILEDTIIQLDSLDKLSRLDKPSQYGRDTQERLFQVALELAITWVNRILFLKLLEAQLMTYHKGNKAYAFLSLEKIKNYDDLNSLFFQVLARRHGERNEDVQQVFERVPYLNSSLFEPTDMEQRTLFISNLKDEKAMPLSAQTVLKDPQGKKRTGSLSTLAYLFEFLNAYDFSSEGSSAIQEDNKTLINASVLGLIFEKINGYKDGSFFTPGFITMYMCRETIRKAVVQKFNEAKGWQCASLTEVYNRIDDRQEANAIVNSIKICDPAVGSGHFLVSALNEMIAVKQHLNILLDRDGRRLREYQVEVVNDELIVTDEEGELFAYNPHSKESQRIQETLFHEKQTLIENCLFGVDINTNSVKICRLRLWIELLKNAYYKNATELETLPNIDINIKCGNSLVSRFALDADLKQALKKSNWGINSYRAAVGSYRSARNKEEKRELEGLIAKIKSDFRSEISRNDPKVKKLYVLSGELTKMATQQSLFDMEAKAKAAWNQKVLKMTEDVQALESEIEAIKSNKIFENAFEWRFEFPEVLNDEGDFVGFDVVIGNPPYIRQEEFLDLKPHLQSKFTTFTGTADLYVYFIELSLQLLRQKGNFIFIVPNKWMRAGYGRNLRPFIKQFAIQQILDFGDLPVFEEATTYPCILHLTKSAPTASFEAVNISTLHFSNGLSDYVDSNKIEVLTNELSDEGWNLSDSKMQKLLAKIKAKGTPLKDLTDNKIFRGVLTGLNEAFVIDAETRERLIAEDSSSSEVIKPFLAGRDIKRYQSPRPGKFLILLRNGETVKLIGEKAPEQLAFNKMQERYPAVMNHLSSFEKKAKARHDQGQYWWELRSCDYYDEFEKSKVMLPDISLRCEALMDEDGFYSVNTAYVIPGLTKSDLGILNSSLILFFYSNLTQTIRGGYFRFIRQYLAQIPIIQTDILEELVSEILKAKQLSPTADTTALEAEIDRLVYALYGLTEEEIAIIEGS